MSLWGSTGVWPVAYLRPRAVWRIAKSAGGTPVLPSVTLLAVALISLTFVAACSRQPPAPPAGPAPITVARGPIHLELRLSADTLRVGDTIDATLEVRTPSEFEIDFPSFALPADCEALSNADPTMTLATDGARVWRSTTRFEPTVSGEIELPAQMVRYRQVSGGASQPAEEWAELTTAATKLTVQSELTDADQTDAPREITGILAAPPVRLSAWQIAAIAAGVLAAAGLVWCLVRALVARSRVPAPPVAPEVWALRELERLAAAPLKDAEAVRAHYYDVSAVVREYIERKFWLRAPEMTTEEFLRSLVQDDRRRHLQAALQAEQLRPFLEACDAVKYAALRPGVEEAAETLATARAFIHRSAAAQAEFEGRHPTADERPLRGAA